MMQNEAGSLNISSLYTKFNPFVQALALQLCSNSAEAEDAVQEAWVTVFTHGHQLKSTESFYPWLKRIVINSCHQMTRKGTRMVLVEELPENNKMIEESVERKFDKMADRDRLYGILTELPLQIRETVILRYFTGYNSYEQIAAITGVPTGTVRSRLNDSKRKLSVLWKQLDDIDPAAFNSSEYWNDFYQEICPGAYTDHNLLANLYAHLAEDLKIVFTSGKTAVGPKVFQWGMEDDFAHGSSIKSVDHCCSSGHLSVIKVTFSNSREFPQHCPPSSYFTFLRNQGKLSEMRLYHSDKVYDSGFC
jgi:RNA polymerase sigma factor (sigma-70 family)